MAPCSNIPLEGEAPSLPPQDCVIPPPGSGTRARAGQVNPHVEELSAQLVGAYEELQALRAELEAEREARTRLEFGAAAEARAAHAEGIAEGYRRALAQVLEARAVLSPLVVHSPPRADVHQSVHPPKVDMSTDVHPSSVDMKGGRGEAATAKPKAELLRAKWRDDKKRQRAEKKAAAEGAREMSTVDTSTSDVHLGHVHPVDTTSPVAAPVPPAVRRKPKWMEDTTPSPGKVFFAWFCDERLQRFPSAIVEPRPPARWPEWYAAALAACGGDEERLRATCRNFLSDGWAQGLERPCPASVLVSDNVWPKHVPGQHAGAVLSAQVAPADARRRADLAVGGGWNPVGGACPTGCGAEAWAVVWGQPLCRLCGEAAMDEVSPLSDATVAAWVEARRGQAHGAPQ